MKIQYRRLKTILIQKIENWDNLKPVRGLIEDFFKVAKDAFGYRNSTNIQPNQRVKAYTYAYY